MRDVGAFKLARSLTLSRLADYGFVRFTHTAQFALRLRPTKLVITPGKTSLRQNDTSKVCCVNRSIVKQSSGQIRLSKAPRHKIRYQLSHKSNIP